MRYKLLAFDLDGTALGSDPHRFAPGLAEAAAAAAEAGCVVAAATGRPAACLPADLDPTPPWLSWLVLCDGAEVRDAHSGACLWRKAFSAAALAQVEAAAARCGLPAEYIDREGLYHMTDAARRAVEASGVGAFHKGIVARRGRALAGPAAGLAGREVLKINIPLVPPKARADFEAAAGNAALIMDCGDGLELTAPGAGKLAAVDFLAQRLGCTLAEVMALGDSGNDAALLAAAGLGVAMENAQPEAKAAARALTGRNTDGGAASAIRRWLLAQP